MYLLLTKGINNFMKHAGTTLPQDTCN